MDPNSTHGNVAIVLRRSTAEGTSNEQTKLKKETVFEPENVSVHNGNLIVISFAEFIHIMASTLSIKRTVNVMENLELLRISVWVLTEQCQIA